MQGFPWCSGDADGDLPGKGPLGLGHADCQDTVLVAGLDPIVVHRSEILTSSRVTPGTSATILIASLSSNTSHAGYQDAVTFRSSSGKAPKASY